MDRRTDYTNGRRLRFVEGGARPLHGVAGRLLAVLLAVAPVYGQAPGPVRTVAAVDLDRYVGDWFEIARLPNRFQRRCTGDVRATYARRADGRLDVVNQCQTDEGVIRAAGEARVVDSMTFAKLKVRFAPAVLAFLPFVWGDYWIVGLGDDYTWAVVGSPDREFLWVLARAPRLDADRLAAALAAARASGFDVARLVTTSHAPTPMTRHPAR